MTPLGVSPQGTQGLPLVLVGAAVELPGLGSGFVPTGAGVGSSTWDQPDLGSAPERLLQTPPRAGSSLMRGMQMGSRCQREEKQLMKGSTDKNGEIIHIALKFTSKRSFFPFFFFFNFIYLP